MALWDLPFVHACPVHETILRDACDCGIPLSWRGLMPDWLCRCGISVKDLEVQRADQGIFSVARVIASKTTGLSGGLQRDEQAGTLALPAASLEEFYELAAFLHRLDTTFVLSLAGRRDARRFPAASTARFFIDWPNTFDEYGRRWINRFFESNASAAFFMLPSHSGVARLLKEIRERSSAYGFVSRAQAHLLDTIRKQVVPVPWPEVLLIRADINVRQVREWLLRFFQVAETCENTSPVDQAAETIARPRHRKEIRLLLASMVAAADLGVPVERCREAALAWPPIADCTSCDDLTWFGHAISPLYALGPVQLKHIRKGLNDAIACE